MYAIGIRINLWAARSNLIIGVTAHKELKLDYIATLHT